MDTKLSVKSTVEESMNIPNKTLDLLGDNNLEEWDGNCLELANYVMKELGEDKVRILYVDFANWKNKKTTLKPNEQYTNGEPYGWLWHAVPVIDGLVHDAWFPELILPPEDYAKTAFPNQDIVLEVSN